MGLFPTFSVPACFDEYVLIDKPDDTYHDDKEPAASRHEFLVYPVKTTTEGTTWPVSERGWHRAVA